VEIYCRPLNLRDDLAQRNAKQMKAVDSGGNGNHHFQGEIPCRETGKYGFTIRVLPGSRKTEAPWYLSRI
jgi:hypothetical protein